MSRSGNAVGLWMVAPLAAVVARLAEVPAAVRARAALESEVATPPSWSAEVCRLTIITL